MCACMRICSSLELLFVAKGTKSDQLLDLTNISILYIVLLLRVDWAISQNQGWHGGFSFVT